MSRTCRPIGWRKGVRRQECDWRKGVRHQKPERPEGCFAFLVSDPFSPIDGTPILRFDDALVSSLRGP